jgi:hypothetical protein
MLNGPLAQVVQYRLLLERTNYYMTSGGRGWNKRLCITAIDKLPFFFVMITVRAKTIVESMMANSRTLFHPVLTDTRKSTVAAKGEPLGGSSATLT